MAARRSIRGAGTDRPGATDTTMLIWKVIDANPGITRDEIFDRIEHEIPAGWAKRRYLNQMDRWDRDRSIDLAAARRYVLTHTLKMMRLHGSIANAEAGYRTLREIRRYRGRPDQVDATGSVAAEHLNDAYALRTAEAWVARGSSRTSAAEREAIIRVIRAMRRLSS